jgi:hypothetical protein
MSVGNFVGCVLRNLVTMPTTMEMFETFYPEADSPPPTASTTIPHTAYDGCWAVSEAFWKVVVDDRLAANPINRLDPTGLKGTPPHTYSDIYTDDEINANVYSGVPLPSRTGGVATIYIWEWGPIRGVGHASMAYDDVGVHGYVSFWPSVPVCTFRDKWVYSDTYGLQHDIDEHKRIADHTIKITGVDAKKIHDAWMPIRRSVETTGTPLYALWSFNCVWRSRPARPSI